MVHRLSLVVAPRFSCPCGILVLWSGIETASSALQDGFLNTGLLGKSLDFLFKHRVGEPALLKWIGALAWCLTSFSRSSSYGACILGGALLQAGCTWGPQASRLPAFREFLQCLIYIVVHCYHSQCMCLCMCELQKAQTLRDSAFLKNSKIIWWWWS